MNKVEIEQSLLSRLDRIEWEDKSVALAIYYLAKVIEEKLNE